MLASFLLHNLFRAGCRVPSSFCFRSLFTFDLPCFRSFSRRTNFNPDQMSVTAQTFTSTNPARRPTSRIASSLRSVTTPELFFGQLTHNIPAGASAFEIRRNSFSSSAADLLNNMAKSSAPAWPPLAESLCDSTRQSASASLNSARTSSGAFTKKMRKPGLMPSFFGSGVPEYPGMGERKRSDLTRFESKGKANQDRALAGSHRECREEENAATGPAQNNRGGRAPGKSCDRWLRSRSFENARQP